MSGLQVQQGEQTVGRTPGVVDLEEDHEVLVQALLQVPEHLILADMVALTCMVDLYGACCLEDHGEAVGLPARKVCTNQLPVASLLLQVAAGDSVQPARAATSLYDRTPPGGL